MASLDAMAPNKRIDNQLVYLHINSRNFIYIQFNFFFIVSTTHSFIAKLNWFYICTIDSNRTSKWYGCISEFSLSSPANQLRTPNS